MADWNGYLKGGISTIGNLSKGNVGGAILSGIGATMSLFGKKSDSARKAAEQQYQYNLALQQQSQKWNEYMYKNRYQMQKDDLEKAGINPLFGLGQAPSVTSGMNSIGMPDYVNEQNNKFNNMMSLLDFGQNLSAKRAQTKLIEQQVLTEEQNTLLRTAEVLGRQLENEWLPKEKKAEIENKIADTMDKLASVNERYANIKLKGTESARIAEETKPMKRYNKIIEKNPELGKIIEGLDRTGMTGKAFGMMLKQGGTGLRLLLNSIK